MIKIPETNVAAFYHGTNVRIIPCSDPTREGFGAFLMDLLPKETQGGDTVEFLGHALFPRDKGVILGDLTIRGFGDAVSSLTTEARIDGTGSKPDSTPGMMFGKNETILEDLALSNECYDPNEDGCVIGFSGKGKAKATLRRVYVKLGTNNDWGVGYNWYDNQGNDQTLIIEDSRIEFSRFGVAFAASDSMGTLKVSRTTFIGKANGSTSIGDTSRVMKSDFTERPWGLCVPVLARSGNVWLEDVVCYVSGYEGPYRDKRYGVPRVVGVVTDLYSTGTSKKTVVDGRNVFVRYLAPGHATEVFDVDIRYGKYTPFDNSAAIATAEQSVQPQRDEAAKLTSQADATVAAARGGSGTNGEVRVWKP